jgi:inorganic pyrophosphatase
LKSEKHFIDDYSPRSRDGRIQAVIEIPAGTNAKWEVDKSDGFLKWEFKKGKPRVVQYLPYPGNYGMIPRTLLAEEAGGDGDPLDVLVLGPSVQRGAVVEAKLVGVLRLLDGGEQDDKLLAVMSNTPLGDVSNLTELKEKFPNILEIVNLWMTSYKGPGEIVSNGFGDTAAANRILESAIQQYESPVAATR